MVVYQVPEGYPEFKEMVELFKKNLPEKFEITETQEGGKMPMFTAGKMVGSISIRQNAFNGMNITLTSTDGAKNDSITIEDYTPNLVLRFLHSKVLGYLTALILPAIYGSSNKIYDVVDGIIMQNLKANELDTSVTGSIKSMFKGGEMGVRRSSVEEKVDA